MHQSLLVRIDGFPTNQLNEDEQEPSAIQRGDGQEIENAQAHADDDCKSQNDFQSIAYGFADVSDRANGTCYIR